MDRDKIYSGVIRDFNSTFGDVPESNRHLIKKFINSQYQSIGNATLYNLVRNNLHIALYDSLVDRGVTQNDVNVILNQTADHCVELIKENQTDA